MPHDDRRRPRSPRAPLRGGVALVELVAGLAIVGAIGAVALPRLRRTLDVIAVHSATSAIAAACAVARSAAIMRGTRAVVVIDAPRRRVSVAVGADTLLARTLEQPPYRLVLDVSRATIAYGPTGLGYGAANTSVVARQGSAADTLYTSRLGRVRH